MCQNKTIPLDTTFTEKQHFIMQALLSESYLEDDFLLTCLKEFKIDLHPKKQLLLLQMVAPVNPANISLFKTKTFQLLQRLDSNIYYFHYPKQYDILVEADTMKEVYPFILEFADQNKHLLTIAIGTSCNIFKLRHSYQSALWAIKYAKIYDLPIITFHNMFLEKFVFNQQPFVISLFSQLITPLSQDEKDLLHTYLHNNQKLSTTAEQLFMHKNTLQNILKNIHKKTELDPRVFQDAILLFLSLKSQELENIRESTHLPLL